MKKKHNISHTLKNLRLFDISNTILLELWNSLDLQTKLMTTSLDYFEVVSFYKNNTIIIGRRLIKSSDAWIWRSRTSFRLWACSKEAVAFITWIWQWSHRLQKSQNGSVNDYIYYYLSLQKEENAQSKYLEEGFVWH